MLNGAIALTKQTVGAEAGPADSVADGGEHITCAHCGAQVAEGQRSCPECGRGVYRTCFCGWRIPVNQAICPNCNADWSQSMRVARKSRSRTPRRRTALRHAAIGAVTALAVTVVAYVVVTWLATRAAGGEPPSGPLSRMELAAEGLRGLAAGVWAAIVRHAGAVASVLAIAALGALIGVGVYALRLGSRNRSSRQSTRRLRRKRRR